MNATSTGFKQALALVLVAAGFGVFSTAITLEAGMHYLTAIVI